MIGKEPKKNEGNLKNLINKVKELLKKKDDDDDISLHSKSNSQYIATEPYLNLILK